jgi:NAD+ synthase (glutamine-hydrolysing)
MALSNRHHWLLLATGNKSELATGYCTLYGDLCGGLAPIGDVMKTQVYALSRRINAAREIIPVRVLTRPPSAELKPNQTDQDSLPPYEILDEILQAYVEDEKGVEEIVKMGFSREVVMDVRRRIATSEHKRRQAPPTLKVTSRAFGHGRRFPIARKIL